MTLPYERRNAVENVYRFLWALSDPKQTPRVPKAIRVRAIRLLKHYPSAFDMKDVHRAFGAPVAQKEYP